MKVRAVAPYQLAWEGKTVPPGQSLDAPDGVAEQWIRNGWAEKVTTAKKATAKKQPAAANKKQSTADNK